MIEKVIAAALEPLLDDLLALEKRFNDLQLQTPEKGEPGRDADPVQVAKQLKHDPDFLRAMHTDAAQSETLEIDADDLARVLDENKGLCELLRGRPGDGIDTALHLAGNVYRENALVTAHLGQYFRALRDTVAAPGESADWQRIGCAGFRWRKLKPDEKTLQEGDLYIDGGSLFLYTGGRASMIVQRGKSGHAITQIKIDDTELVCEMDSGKLYRADLAPLLKNITDALKPPLAHMADTLTDLTTRLAILESNVKLLDDALGGQA